MARPTKFRRDVVDRILAGIRLGSTYQHACWAAGVHYATFNEWKKGNFPNMPRGLTEAQKQDFRNLKDEFNDLLMMAEGEAIRRNWQVVQKAAAEGDWRAAQFALSVRWPGDYSKRTEVTGAGGSPIALQAIVQRAAAEDGLDPADIEAEMQRLLDGTGDE